MAVWCFAILPQVMIVFFFSPRLYNLLFCSEIPGISPMGNQPGCPEKNVYAYLVTNIHIILVIYNNHNCFLYGNQH